MVAKLINEVLVAMGSSLSSNQQERLRSVLQQTFSKVELIEKTESDTGSEDVSVIQTFLAAKRVEGCSEKSMHYYDSTIRNALRAINKSVKDISTDDLRHYLDDYQQRSGASRVTVDNIRRILSSFFAWLEEEFYIVKSPVRRIHKVKTGKVVKETYSDEALELMSPSWMCENFSSGGRSGKRLKKANYGDYAKHLVDFVNYMKGQGVNIHGISVQNEPDYGQEWTWWTSAECVEFLAKYGSQIKKVTKMISPETFQYNKQYYKDILGNSQANANTDIFATHFYGTLRSQMDFPQLETNLYPRELWMTEVYVPNSSSSADKWPEAIEVAVNMHNAFVIGGMNAYVWWYIRRSYGPMLENGNISKRGYMMAHFSKWVRPFAGRIGATEQPTNNVWISAYKNYQGSLVIVAINNSDTGYSQQFEVKGFTVKRVDRYRTTSSENLGLTANIALTGNGFWAYLGARSVQTFVCTS